MKPNSIVLSATLLVAGVNFAMAEEGPAVAISSGRNDVVYLAPATEPYEALPLGNGQLGVMLHNAPALNYLFNHGSFFANAEQDNELISSGEFAVELPEAWRKGFLDQRLALHDAVIITRYQTGTDTHTVKSWMPEGLDLMVVEIESTAVLPDFTATLSIWERNIGSTTVAGQKDIALATVGAGGHRTALAVRVVCKEHKQSRPVWL